MRERKKEKRPKREKKCSGMRRRGSDGVGWATGGRKVVASGYPSDQSENERENSDRDA